MERLIEPLLIVFPQSVQPFLKQVFFLAQIIFVLDLKRDHLKKQVVKDLAHEPTPVEEQSVKFVLENFLEDVAQGNYAHLVRVFVVQPEVFGDAEGVVLLYYDDEGIFNQIIIKPIIKLITILIIIYNFIIEQIVRNFNAHKNRFSVVGICFV